MCLLKLEFPKGTEIAGQASLSLVLITCGKDYFPFKHLLNISSNILLVLVGSSDVVIS